MHLYSTDLEPGLSLIGQVGDDVIWPCKIVWDNARYVLSGNLINRYPIQAHSSLDRGFVKLHHGTVWGTNFEPAVSWATSEQPMREAAFPVQSHTKYNSTQYRPSLILSLANKNHIVLYLLTEVRYFPVLCECC